MSSVTRQRLACRRSSVDEETATGFIELPEDAVIGQDPETWLRAGKEYPL